jgi:hypothetical protein
VRERRRGRRPCARAHRVQGQAAAPGRAVNNVWLTAISSGPRVAANATLTADVSIENPQRRDVQVLADRVGRLLQGPDGERGVRARRPRRRPRERPDERHGRPPRRPPRARHERHRPAVWSGVRPRHIHGEQRDGQCAGDHQEGHRDQVGVGGCVHRAEQGPQLFSGRDHRRYWACLVQLFSDQLF